MTPNQTTNLKIALGTLAAVLVVGTGIGAYFWRIDQREGGGALVDTPENDQDLNPQGNPDVSGAQSPTSTPSTTAEIKPAPAPATAAVTTKLYTNNTMRFSVSVQGNWIIKPAADEVVFTAPQSIRYSIQAYAAEGNDLASLKAFLATQSNLHNIADAKIAGYEAVSFTADGPYRRGYAFISGSRIFYLMGPSVENTQLAKTFKTF